MNRRRLFPLALLTLSVAGGLLVTPALAQDRAMPIDLRIPGFVQAYQKISDTDGGFAGALDSLDAFGYATASLGDLDGDGTPDLAVGATLDDDGGPDRGAVWILLLHPDGTARTHQKLSGTAGGLIGAFDDGDRFGASIAPLGDLDGDGVPDLAVGAALDEGTRPDRGAVWVLFLDGEAPDLSLEATVTAGAPIPPSGGTFSFDIDVINHTDVFTVFDLWLVATNPTTGFERRLPLFSDRVLAPEQSGTYVRNQTVPGSAPAGTYLVTVYAGDYPGSVVASTAFEVEKAGATRTGPLAQDWSGTWREQASTTPTVASLTTRRGTMAMHAAPNPSAGRTALGYELPAAAHVRLVVYDVLGREVARLVDGAVEAGRHAAVLDGSALPAGTYLVRLTADGRAQTQRLTLLR